MSALGDGDWKLISITDNFPAVNSPKLASTTSGDGLPLKLPIGSTKAIRDYITASNGLSMNIIVGLAVYGPLHKELTNSRWSYGYASYDRMLADSRRVMSQAIDMFGTNSISSDTMVYAILMVTYFNDSPSVERWPIERWPIALDIINPASTFGTLTLDKAMDVLGLDDPSYTELVIVPVPKLAKVEVVAEIEPGVQATMTWAIGGGPQLSSTWKEKDPSRESTIAGYLYLKAWAADGSIRSRISLTTDDETVTYTQFGVRITPPKFTIRKGEVDVTVASGSDTDIFSSRDLNGWTSIQSLRSFHSTSDYPTATFTVPMGQSHMIFRGVSY